MFRWCFEACLGGGWGGVGVRGEHRKCIQFRACKICCTSVRKKSSSRPTFFFGYIFVFGFYILSFVLLGLAASRGPPRRGQCFYQAGCQKATKATECGTLTCWVPRCPMRTSQGASCFAFATTPRGHISSLTIRCSEKKKLSTLFAISKSPFSRT